MKQAPTGIRIGAGMAGNPSFSDKNLPAWWFAYGIGREGLLNPVQGNLATTGQPALARLVNRTICKNET